MKRVSGLLRKTSFVARDVAELAFRPEILESDKLIFENGVAYILAEDVSNIAGERILDVLLSKYKHLSFYN